jgi:hypothetical protein
MDVGQASVDALEQRLLTLEGVVSAARAEQATIAAEVDRRRVPQGDGCRTLAEWLAARLDLSPESAAALSRLARTDHSGIVEAAARGEMSFDLAVEAERLARLIGEGRTLEPASVLGVAGLRRLVAFHRRITRRHEQELFDERHVTVRPTAELTGFRLWGSLPGLDGSIVEKALHHRADQVPARPDGTHGPLGQRMADALVSICQDSLAGAHPETAATVVATVFVDAAVASATGGEAGSTLSTGIRVGPDTLAAVLCGGAVQVTVTDQGRPLWSSPTTRAIPPATRRSVLARDGGCVADGCTSRYRLQPHHIRHRTHGGDHDPDNVATLCWWHHHVVVHRMGYQIDPSSPPHRRRFLRPDHGP